MVAVAVLPSTCLHFHHKKTVKKGANTNAETMDRHKHSATDSTDTALATSSRNISAISRNHATSWSNAVCSMPMSAHKGIAVICPLVVMVFLIALFLTVIWCDSVGQNYGQN